MSEQGTWTTTLAGNRVFRPAMVTCRECGETKPRERMSRAERHYGWCKDCRNRYRREAKLRKQGTIRQPRRDADGNWRCADCKRQLPPSSYQMRDRGHGPEPMAYCRECTNRQRRETHRLLASMRKGGW